MEKMEKKEFQEEKEFHYICSWCGETVHIVHSIGEEALCDGCFESYNYETVR